MEWESALRRWHERWTGGGRRIFGTAFGFKTIALDNFGNKIVFGGGETLWMRLEKETKDRYICGFSGWDAQDNFGCIKLCKLTDAFAPRHDSSAMCERERDWKIEKMNSPKYEQIRFWYFVPFRCVGMCGKLNSVGTHLLYDTQTNEYSATDVCSEKFKSWIV